MLLDHVDWRVHRRRKEEALLLAGSGAAVLAGAVHVAYVN
jgi:hypothetical protein